MLILGQILDRLALFPHRLVLTRTLFSCKLLEMSRLVTPAIVLRAHLESTR